jgi:hypothetical protein
MNVPSAKADGYEGLRETVGQVHRLLIVASNCPVFLPVKGAKSLLKDSSESVAFCQRDEFRHDSDSGARRQSAAKYPLRFCDSPIFPTANRASVAGTASKRLDL